MFHRIRFIKLENFSLFGQSVILLCFMKVKLLILKFVSKLFYKMVNYSQSLQDRYFGKPEVQIR